MYTCIEIYCKYDVYYEYGDSDIKLYLFHETKQKQNDAKKTGKRND